MRLLASIGWTSMLLRSAAAVALVAAVAAALSGRADAAACALPSAGCGGVEPVPSLEPRATDAQWSRLVGEQRRNGYQPLARTDCRPLRAVFYAPTDWLRLATKLAAAASPCAQYYVTVPPLTSDKTRQRPDQAWRIRALGPNMHALAEIHMNTWRAWVKANGSSWYAAGVEARTRMAAAGYDVAAGDGWAVNELSSAVRRNVGTARADTREFLRGLHDGDGTLPPARGTVFVVGLGQSSPDLAAYREKMQTWLLDSTFWTSIAPFVADWAQEAYADVRAYAAEGVGVPERRSALNEYLQHPLALAAAGPDAASAARDLLNATYMPIGNAAWQWLSKFGWTAVTADEMKDFVSAQTFAMRSASVSRPEGDRFGFAWAPQNLSGQPKGQFAAQAAQVLERLAEAIRDSAEVPAGDPGSAACGPAGQNLWCTRALPGAVITARWRSFSSWSANVLGFTTQLRELPAGAVSGPLAVRLQVGRIPTPALQPLTVTLSSSSPAGAFAPTSEGPFTPTLTLPLGLGATATPFFVYRDTKAGSSVVTATTEGALPGSQSVSVLAGEPVSLTVSPGAASVPAGGSQLLTAGGLDAFGNPAALDQLVWSVGGSGLGGVSPTSGATTTFQAVRAGDGVATVRATLQTGAGTLTAEARLEVVLPPTIRVASVRQRPAGPRLRVVTRVVDAAGRPVGGAVVLLTVTRDGKRHVALRGRTDGRGLLVVRPRAALGGCYSTRVRNVAKPGKRWRQGTPANRVCRRAAVPRK